MKIKRIDLEKIYRENTNKEACKILGICNFTLTAYLRQMGIKLKGSGNGIKKNKLTIICKRAGGLFILKNWERK